MKPNKEKEKALLHETLIKLLDYNINTGLFTWKCNRSGSAKKGTVAGAFKHTSGYVVIKVMGNIYLAHRLAWFYVYKVWPNNLIDHIDRDKHNNKLNNLREATYIDNNRNSLIHGSNTSGSRGVFFDTSINKWRSQIYINKVRHNLGTYNTIEEATIAYTTEAKKVFGDFYNG